MHVTKVNKTRTAYTGLGETKIKQNKRRALEIEVRLLGIEYTFYNNVFVHCRPVRFSSSQNDVAYI